MAITFAPSSLNFGEVALGDPSTKTITVANDGNADAPVTAPRGAFSIVAGPATIAAGGRAAITVRFDPGRAQAYSGGLTVGPESCSLVGTGVSDATTITPSGSQKSLFIAVPDFGTSTFQKHPGAGGDGAKSEDVTMTSFLRLGNFDYGSESEKAKGLLALIHQTGSPGDPLRGDNHFVWDAEKDGFAQMPPFQGRNGDVSPEEAGNRDVFFLDDVRRRDVDVVPALLDEDHYGSVQGNGLTLKQRQEESAKLYSRGGWRDHSDGNRITTTYGDKVEVIRGNYKMIVMGRQEDPADAQGWEASGSHVADFAPGTMPGASYWLEWVPDYVTRTKDDTGKAIDVRGVWLLANTTENVYQFARNAGNFRTETWGNLNETYIGSENPPDAPVATDATHGTRGHEPPARVDGIAYELPERARKEGEDPYARPRWEDDNRGKIRSNPHVVTKTWAQRIDAWNGSESCPVPMISEVTWANETRGDTHVSGTIEDTTRASDITSETHASGTISECTEAGSLKSTTTADVVEEATKAGIVTTFSEIGASGEVAIVASSAAVTIAGVQSELTIAAAQNAFNMAGIHLEAELAAIHMSLELSAIRLQLSGSPINIEAAPSYLRLIEKDDKSISNTKKWFAHKIDLGLPSE